MTIKEKYKLSVKKAIKLALPIVAGQLGLVLMGFFDTVQLGKLGVVYIDACAIANSQYFLVLLLGMGILFSVSPLVSEAYGEEHPWKCIGIFRSGAAVAAGISVLFYLAILVVVHYFALLRENDTITGLSQKFLIRLNYSTPMLIFFTLGKQFMDGMGRTRVSMTVTLIGLVCNVFLNWVFIYGHLGAPGMGIEGAATATGISRTFMCFILFIYIFNDKKVKALLAEYRVHALNSKNYVADILRIGIPSGFQIFFEVGAFNMAIVMSGWLGNINLAAFQVAINLASITFMMASGLASAGTILTGFAYGAKDKDLLKISGNTVYMLAFVTQAFFALVFLLFRNFLPTMYTSDAQVIGIASQLLLMAAIFQLSDGFQVVGVCLLRGMQDVKLPSALAFASYWLIMVPLGYLLAFHFGFGIRGIWIGFVVGLTIAAILMYARFHYMLKRIRFTEL